MAEKYRVVRGEYVILGKQPDGDSIRFRAEDVNLFKHLPGGGHVKITRHCLARLAVDWRS